MKFSITGAGGTGLLAAVLLSSAFSVHAQAPATPPPASVSAEPEYDVAVIRQMKFQGREFSMMIMDPPRTARFQASAITMRRLLNLAYGKRRNEIGGGPTWIDENLYEVNARADTSVDKLLEGMTEEQARHTRQRMLQDLLIDRCKLTMRTEPRVTTVYSLVQAKGGTTLKTSPESDSSEPKAGLQVLADRIVFVHAPIRMLLEVLAQETHHSVVDATGLTGVYDFTLTFARQTMQGDPADSNLPPLDKALAAQLGLKIDSAKSETQEYVIESISRPRLF